MGRRKDEICAYPVTKAQHENISTRRSTLLQSRLLQSRGRHTRRIVLISLTEGSVKEVSRFKAIGIARFVRIRGCSRMVRVMSVIRKGGGKRFRPLSLISSFLPTKALSKTPGVHTVRVVSRLRDIHEKLCKNTAKCVSFSNSVSFYVAVQAVVGGGGHMCLRTKTKVITSSIPRGRCRRYYGGMVTLTGALVRRRGL